MNLTDRSKHQFKDEGPEKPSQNGIAYSFGSKDYTVRQKPSDSKCSVPVYGLDCSGMVNLMFKETGIQGMDGNAETQSDIKVIQSALEKSLPQLKKIKVDDLKRLETDKIRTGDIIYWLDTEATKYRDNPQAGTSTHIGIALRSKDGSLKVFQSSGRNPDQVSDNIDCQKNRGDKKGPATFGLNNSYWFGNKAIYGVVRFNFEIAGEWEFHLKCIDKPTDAFVLGLTFPPSTNKTFSITKQFPDYDGSTVTTQFEYSYDNTTSELSCVMIIKDSDAPNFERKETFSVKLERDKTGYISTKQEYLHNGTGCSLEVQLINKG